jgi:TonB family protein
VKFRFLTHDHFQMRRFRIIIFAVVLGASCVAVAQGSNNGAGPPAKSESQNKSNCEPPKAIFSPSPLPPASWQGTGPKSAVTQLELMVDKKGKVHDPRVIQSGGDDVDKQAIEAVRSWRFKRAECRSDPLKIQINVTIQQQ